MSETLEVVRARRDPYGVRQYVSFGLLLLLAVFCAVIFMRREGSPDASGSARRIVVLNGDALEVIRAVGAMDRVIGTSETIAQERSFWPELGTTPAVGRWNEPSFEKIAKLKPDRVLAYRHTPGPELEKTLSRLGVGITRMDFYRPSTFSSEVRELGRMLERPAEAERLVTWWESKLADLRITVARTGTRPSVLIEGYTRFRTANASSGIHEMVELAGGRNLAAALPVAYPDINPEWVLKAAPEVIIKTASTRDTYGAKSADVLGPFHAELVGRTGWAGLPAVRNDRVHILAPDIGPGPRAIVGIYYLLQWIHPELARDVNPADLHRDYLERFQGRPLKGYFVYPES